MPQFRRAVWSHYKKFGRHDLPWRQTRDVYKILVSEIMLQQTQVERVVPFYKKFIKRFPTARRLAAAPLAEVLKAWQGLGYNRRAKFIHAAAKEFHKLLNLAYRPKQGVTDVARELERLPGVGPYTARAIVAFAFNADVVFVETNIRTAIIHHFFSATQERSGMIYHTSAQRISDARIEEVLTKVLPRGRAREWYSALMDYGAHLKRSGISHNERSSKYVTQPKFSGSLREARGAIVRGFARGITSHTQLTNLLGPRRKKQMTTALNALIREGLIT